MSVDQPQVIDIVSVNKDEEIELVISDHLDWMNTIEHQEILQKKINCYLSYIDCGQLYQDYPVALNKHVVIRIFFTHAPDLDGMTFIEESRKVIEAGGNSLKFKLLPEAQGN